MEIHHGISWLVRGVWIARCSLSHDPNNNHRKSWCLFCWDQCALWSCNRYSYISSYMLEMAHVVRWFAKFKHGETVIVSWNFASKGTSILERPFFWAVIFHGEIHGFCTWIESSLATKSQARLHAGCCWWLVEYPLGMTNIAIENGHRNSGFSHEKWWFSIVMLNYQRVFDQPSQLNIGCFLVTVTLIVPRPEVWQQRPMPAPGRKGTGLSLQGRTSETARDIWFVY